jgi:hypothetical protein
MPQSSAIDLLRKCAEALSGGCDFPAIWHDVLRVHPLVTGVPIQAAPDRLEIRLIHHQRLVFDLTHKKVILG